MTRTFLSVAFVGMTRALLPMPQAFVQRNDVDNRAKNLNEKL